MEKIVESTPVTLSISVVSHGQMGLIQPLMEDIQKLCSQVLIEFILTLNIKEEITINRRAFSYPIRVLENAVPQGFGANHNQAFKIAKGQFFCIVNPDIRLHKCPFLSLQQCLEDILAGVIAPMVLSPSGSIEDSARHFPTLIKLFKKIVTKKWSSDYLLQDKSIDVDWVGGMFMLFPRQVFDELHGFDERYFLYYEDVDLCARLHLAGYRVAVCPQAQVIHHAQRSSHRSFKFLRWHLASMLRFFLSPVYRQLKRQRQP